MVASGSIPMANYAGMNVDLRPGAVLAGKYRVERVLGAGGMGVVIAAQHIQLDEKVALKFLLPEAVASPGAVQRFLQEARAAVKVKSEHVARVIDVGQLENGAPYMVMEYLAGRDLGAWLTERGALPFAQAVDFILQACEALADAHTIGIVHRDLKPANLFCIERSDGELSIKVLDFGISKVTTPGAAGHDMTRTNALMGSPLYMSPEQMKMTKGVDARSDIWSLGIILFELMTGRRPFDAEAVTDLAIKVATEPAPSLREFRRDAPPGLEQVVARCLEKDRARRFQTVGELALALRDYGSRNAHISVDRVLRTLQKAGITQGTPYPINAVGSSATTQRDQVPATAASWGNTGGNPGTNAPSGGKTLLVVGAVLIALVGLGAGGFVALHRRPTADVSAAALSAESPPARPSVPVVAPTVNAPPVATASAAIVPSASAAPVPPTSAVAVPPPPPPKPTSDHKPPRPGGGPAADRPRSDPPAAAKPNCNPPYVIDAAGDRQYKPECI